MDSMLLDSGEADWDLGTGRDMGGEEMNERTVEAV